MNIKEIIPMTNAYKHLLDSKTLWCKSVVCEEEFIFLARLSNGKIETCIEKEWRSNNIDPKQYGYLIENFHTYEPVKLDFSE
jgi:hypothetical protein